MLSRGTSKPMNKRQTKKDLKKKLAAGQPFRTRLGLIKIVKLSKSDFGFRSIPEWEAFLESVFHT